MLSIQQCETSIVDKLRVKVRFMPMRGFIFLLLSFYALFGQTVQITGTYLDLLDNPIDSAVVTYSADNIIVDSARTDGSGNFTLNLTYLSLDPVLPKGFYLGQNYPNPFNPSTRISLSVNEPGSFAVYDIRGALVEHVELTQTGRYELTWGGRNLPAGLYLYVLRTITEAETRKMILLDGGDGTGLHASYLFGNAANRLRKLRSEGALSILKDNTTPFEMTFDSPLADSSLGVLNGNVGPRQIQTVPDTTMYEGDTLHLDWNEYFYNDSETYFPPRFIEFMYLTDTTFYETDVVAIDVLDTNLITRSNTFSMTWLPVNDPPSLLWSPTDTSMLEDETLSLDLTQVFEDEDSELSYSISSIQHADTTWESDSVVMIVPYENWYGTLQDIVLVADDGEYQVETDPFTLVVYPVNDPPIFRDTITDTTFEHDAFDPEYRVFPYDHFSDVDGDELVFSINLESDYYWFDDGTYHIWPYEEDSLEVVISASDGEYSANSNVFEVNWLAEPPPDTFMVHFEMRDFKTDTVLSSDTSTWWIDGAEYVSTNGMFDTLLVEEHPYAFNATNPNTIDLQEYLLAVESIWPYLTFLRRPGDTENFEQRAGGGDSTCFVAVSNQDTIIAYKIMADFDLVTMRHYLNYLHRGTIRFGPNNLESYAWFDTSGSNGHPVNYVRTAIDRLLTEEIPRVTQEKLQLEYYEGDESPELGTPKLRMFINHSVPGSGNNGTSSENGYLTWCEASWPWNPGVAVLYIEILQAIGDLPDLAGGDPPIISNTGDGWIINQLGEDMFGLLYFVLPGTYFSQY